MLAIPDSAGNSAGKSVPANNKNNQTNLDFDKPHRIKVLHGNLEGFYSTATVTMALTVFGGKLTELSPVVTS